MVTLIHYWHTKLYWKGLLKLGNNLNLKIREDFKY